MKASQHFSRRAILGVEALEARDVPAGILYGANAVDIYTVDTTTGTVSLVGFEPQAGATEIEFNPATQLMVSATQAYSTPSGPSTLAQFTVPDLQLLQPEGILSTRLRIGGMEYAKGQLYGVAVGLTLGRGSPPTPPALYIIDPTDPFRTTVSAGFLNPVGYTGTGEISGLAYDAARDVFYATAASSDDFYQISRTTGAATLIGHSGIVANSLEFGPDGRLYASDGPNLYTINPTTAAASFVVALSLRVEALTLVGAPAPVSMSNFVVGANGRIPAQVNLYDGPSGTPTKTLQPYGAGYLGAVSVATGDVNGDGTPDTITGSGPGAPGGHVKVFDGATGAELRSFFAFAPGYLGGVNVGAGDLNGDGLADVLVGSANGASHVKVFDSLTGGELYSFFAFGSGFTGGVNVAAGDVDGDGSVDIVTATASQTNQVVVISGRTGLQIRNFLAFPASFPVGVTVAAGDLNGDGAAELIVGTAARFGRVVAFDGRTNAQTVSLFPYGTGFAGGVNVSAADVNKDGKDEIVTAVRSAGRPHVKALDATGAVLSSFYAFDPNYFGGVLVG